MARLQSLTYRLTCTTTGKLYTQHHGQGWRNIGDRMVLSGRAFLYACSIKQDRDIGIIRICRPVSGSGRPCTHPTRLKHKSDISASLVIVPANDHSFGSFLTIVPLTQDTFRIDLINPRNGHQIPGDQLGSNEQFNAAGLGIARKKVLIEEDLIIADILYHFLSGEILLQVIVQSRFSRELKI